MVENRKQILMSLYLLGLFISFQAGITLFSHTHYVNGVMLVHSHPSSDNHTHTEGQILTLAQVSHFTGTEPLLTESVEIILPVLYTLECKRTMALCPSFHIQCIHLRAPPFFC